MRVFVYVRDVRMMHGIQPAYWWKPSSASVDSGKSASPCPLIRARSQRSAASSMCMYVCMCECMRGGSLT
jgi:hypothetical protein